jgi:hypothetical protein
VTQAISGLDVDWIKKANAFVQEPLPDLPDLSPSWLLRANDVTFPKQESRTPQTEEELREAVLRGSGTSWYSYPGEAIAGIPRGAAQTAVGAATGAVELGGELARIAGIDNDVGEWARGIQQTAKAGMEAALPGTPGFEQSWTRAISEGVGSAAVSVPAALAGGVPGLAAFGATSSYANTYDNARSLGASPADARLYARVSAAVGGVTEPIGAILPAIRILKRVDGAVEGRLTAEILKASGRESVQEVLQEIPDEVARQAYLKERTAFDAIGTLAKTGAVGGIVGLIIPGVAAIAQQSLQQRPPTPFEQPPVPAETGLTVVEEPGAPPFEPPPKVDLSELKPGETVITDAGREELLRDHAERQAAGQKDPVPNADTWERVTHTRPPRKERARQIAEWQKEKNTEGIIPKGIQSVLSSSSPSWLRKYPDIQKSWVSGEVSDRTAAREVLLKAGFQEGETSSPGAQEAESMLGMLPSHMDSFSSIVSEGELELHSIKEKADEVRGARGPEAAVRPEGVEAQPIEEKAQAQAPQAEGEAVLEPSERPQFGEATGVVQFNQLLAHMRRGLSAIGAWSKRNLFPEGALPKEVFRLEQTRRRNVNEILSKVTFAVRDFEAASKKAYGPNAKDARTLAGVNAVLRSQRNAEDLPEGVRQATAKMRDHVDVLTGQLIAEGVIEGELAATVDANRGVYLHRSYQVFDDPEWAAKVDPMVRNRFKSWLRKEYADRSAKAAARLAKATARLDAAKTERDVERASRAVDTRTKAVARIADRSSENQLEQQINNLLYEGKAAQGPIAFLSKSKLGSKDLSILKHRTLDDFPELRALYGEYHDPIVNYAKSVTRMANLLESHRFLRSVREQGLGKYIFDPTDPNIDPRASVRIAADASSVMHPLNGLMTYPEIEKAFTDAIKPQEPGPNWLRWYTKANIATKIAKTAFSHATQARNYLGNINLIVSNGYWRVNKAYDAFRVVLEDLNVTKNDKWRALINDGTKHGVLRQSVQAGDIHEMLADLKKADVDFDEALGGWPARKVKKAGKLALKLYGLGDDGPRFYGWLNEIARYQKAYPEWSDEEVKAYTAEIVNRVMPTYEMLPPIIRKLRYFPGGATFVSFPASMVKATYNIIKQFSVELANQRTRAIGTQRLAGFIVAKLGPRNIALATMALLGIDRDEDEAIRKSLPPWDENGVLLYLQKPKEENNWTAAYVNLSSLDPFGMFDRALIAAMRGEDPAQGLALGAAQFLGNFLGEQIVFSKIVDVLRNKRGDSGLPVYNPEDDADKIVEAVATHLLEALVPGSATSAGRLVKAYTGQETETGKVYDPTTETIAQFGMRASTVNMKTALLYDGREYMRRKADAEAIFTRKLFSAGHVPDKELADDHERSEESRRSLFDRLHDQVVGLRKLGLTEDDIAEVFKAAGLSKEHRWEVIEGDYEPHDVSEQSLRNRERSLSLIRPESATRVRQRVMP